MPGGHSLTDKFFRSTIISDGGVGAVIAQANATAGAGANNTTIGRYSAGGTTTGRRFSPTKTQTAQSLIAAVGVAPVGDGWRENAAQVSSPQTDQWTLDGGVNVDVKIRYRRSGQALEVDQAATLHVSVNKVASDGTGGVQLGRTANVNATFTTTTQSITITVALPAGTTVFNAGDLFQVEVGVITVVAGVATPPTVATDLWFVLDEVSASGGKLANNATTYTIQAARTDTESTATQPAADSVSRVFNGSRTLREFLAGHDVQYTYFNFPGGFNDFIQAPDSAALSITGDIDLRARIAPTTWLATQALIAKTAAGAGQRSYELFLTAAGKIQLILYGDGTNFSIATSSAAVSFSAGQEGWVRATWRQSDNRVQFFTAAAGSGPTGGFTQLGTDQTLSATITSIFDGTSSVRLGIDETIPGHNFIGKFFEAQIRNGLGGVTDSASVVARFDATIVPVTGAQTPLSVTQEGTTWTANVTAGWSWATLGSIDTVSRSGSGFHRTQTETVATVDAVTRAFVGARVRTETLSPSDVATRIYQGARALSETVGAASDAVTRSYGAVRARSESVGAAVDSVARTVVFNRTLVETLAAAVDVVARVFVGARVLSEAVGAVSDAVARVFVGARSRTETVGPAADTVARTAQFNRTRTETFSFLDAITRAFVGARARAESVGPASDTISRVYHGNRTIGEGPGDYPTNNGQKAISGHIYDEDTGTPIAGVTIYLIRSSDLQYTGQSTVSAGDGSYSFPRDSGDGNGYLLLVKTDGSTPPKHGVSDEALVPA